MRAGKALVLALLVAGSHSAMAEETSKSYAQMAKAAWSAFECAPLADKYGKPEESDRLFQYGYSQGKKFISALQDGKIIKSDLEAEAPFILLLLLQGPTPDFMLGRIYENAQNSALKDLVTINGRMVSSEDQKLLAASRYNSQNCQLIGVVR